MFARRLCSMIPVIFGCLLPIPPALADEVDFSCMKEMVRGKQQVTDRHKEFDVVLHNQCPGPVYWSMCIERLDPWTNRILESHTPAGRVEPEKKARVNLQMRKTTDAAGRRHRFQEFYYDVGYAIRPPANTSCVAKACEAKKSSLRQQARANDSAWQKTVMAMETRMAGECPEAGWDNTEKDACEAAILAENQEALDRYAQKDQELKDQLAGVDPDRCQAHAGGPAG